MAVFIARRRQTDGDEKMRRDVDDDDASGEYFSRDVAHDGEVVHCPLFLMDSLQRAIHDGMGRPAAQAFDARDHRPGYVRVSSPAIADARRAAREARSEYVQALRDAWKRPPHTDNGEPDAEALKRHLRGDEPDATAARREQAYQRYCSDLAQAWRQPSGGANAIERQGEQWRGGR
jgi:hypothetical protein